MRQDILARVTSTGKPFKIYTDYVEDAAMTQFAECMEQSSVVQGFLAPDVHSGYVAPIGSVLATKGTIFPSFVGYDIGCGMSECMLDIKTSDLTIDQLTQIKDSILKRVPIGFNRHSKPQAVPGINDDGISAFAYSVLDDVGSYQIGTLGGGKDYCFQAQR